MPSTEYNKKYRNDGEAAFASGARIRAKEKKCPICKQTKPAAVFYLSNSNPDGLHGWCKPCSDQRTTENMRKRLGVTPEKYSEMFMAQGRACAICGTTDPGKRDFCLDHDHSSGVARGILCTPCNTLLGQAKDSIEVLESAIKYLKGYKS